MNKKQNDVIKQAKTFSIVCGVFQVVLGLVAILFSAEYALGGAIAFNGIFYIAISGVPEALHNKKKSPEEEDIIEEEKPNN